MNVLLSDDASASASSSVQIILFTKEEMKKAGLTEQTMIGIIWASLMSSVEWNKKEELVSEQAIKHLKVLRVGASATLSQRPESWWAGRT